jgi:hypothetical protein
MCVTEKSQTFRGNNSAIPLDKNITEQQKNKYTIPINLLKKIIVTF